MNAIFETPGGVRGRFWGGLGRFLAGYRRFGRLFEGSGRFGSGVGVVLERFRRFLVSFGGSPGGEALTGRGFQVPK